MGVNKLKDEAIRKAVEELTWEEEQTKKKDGKKKAGTKETELTDSEVNKLNDEGQKTVEDHTWGEAIRKAVAELTWEEEQTKKKDGKKKAGTKETDLTDSEVNKL